MYIHYTKYEWDEKKARANLEKHGVGFDLCEYFSWEEAVIFIDQRRDYGEERRYAIGPIHSQLYLLVYTKRGSVVRIISLRKANRHEREKYEEEKNPKET